MDLPRLVPRPRHVGSRPGSFHTPRQPWGVRGLAEATCTRAGFSPEATPIARFTFDPALAAVSHERYTISVPRQPPIAVRVAGPSAVYPALATLSQLLRESPLPCLEIDDHPKFPTRGFMLDVSRDRIPSMPSLLALIDRLASLKFNHLQLYTEHAFAYAGHTDAWRGSSPITPEDIRRLDAHARPRGISLVPNQNCFGHLTRWLSLPRYAHLAEIHADWDFFEFRRSGPFSLCPLDPGSIALVQDLLTQLLPLFSSPLVNIGCDETVDVGQGRSREAVQRLGRARVYLDFLKQVVEVARRLGRRPMFWGDIALSHPECLPDLPREAIALAWGYEADAPFDRWCEALQGRETWVCPGTSTWRSIVGRTAIRDANIAAAGRAPASGFLLTDWGDMGHRQQPILTLPGLALAAQAAWNPDADLDRDAASALLLGDSSAFAWLDALGEIDADLRLAFGADRPNSTRVPLRNASALYVELHAHDYTYPRAGSPSQWAGVRDRLAEARRRIPGGLTPQARDEALHTLDVADLAAELGLARRQGGGVVPPRDRESLAETLTKIIQTHRTLWLRTCRPGGLTDSTAHYSRARDRILSHG